MKLTIQLLQHGEEELSNIRLTDLMTQTVPIHA